MNFINLFGIIAIFFLFIRVIFLIKIDSYRKKNRVFKFLFGAYAFEALVPIIRKPKSEEEAKFIKTANIFLVIFYVFFVIVLLTVWYEYHNTSNKPVPNDSKANQVVSLFQVTSPERDFATETKQQNTSRGFCI